MPETDAIIDPKIKFEIEAFDATGKMVLREELGKGDYPGHGPFALSQYGAMLYIEHKGERLSISLVDVAKRAIDRLVAAAEEANRPKYVVHVSYNGNPFALASPTLDNMHAVAVRCMLLHAQGPRVKDWKVQTKAIKINPDRSEEVICVAVRNGKRECTPRTYNECLMWIQNHSSHSFDWLRQHEGWDVAPYDAKIHGAPEPSLHDELTDAYESDGGDPRVTFRQWLRNMADDVNGTLRDAAAIYLRESGI